MKGDADFCITIKYNVNKGPSRAFKRMALVLDSINALEQDLVKSIHQDNKTTILLHEVSVGSLKGWFISQLKEIDDEDLRDLNWKRMIGKFLVQSKHGVLNYLEKKENEKIQLQDLRNIIGLIEQNAADTKVNKIPLYQPIPIEDLANDIGSIQKNIIDVDSEESISIITDLGEVYLNPKAQIDTLLYDELNIVKKEQQEMTLILKVKKPDYLGESQWEFKHGPKRIYANIHDENWIKKFRNREIILAPGDSIKAQLFCEFSYDSQNTMTHERYDIVKVIDVLLEDKVYQDDIGL